MLVESARFLFADVFKPGSLVEVTNGNSGWCGCSGIVQQTRQAIVTIEVTDAQDKFGLAEGDLIEVPEAYCNLVPTQTELRREKRKLRERHLQEMKDPYLPPDPGIREYSERVWPDNCSDESDDR